MKTPLVAILVLTLLSQSFAQSDDSDILFSDQSTQQPSSSQSQSQSQSTSSEQNSNTGSTSPKSSQSVPFLRQFNFDKETLIKYKYQVGAIFCIFFYLIAYRRGKAQNYQLIETFYNKVRPYVYNNFAHIGFTKNFAEDPFVAQSPSQALFYASGRENIQYLQIKFNMLKRQDLLYHFIYETIYPEKDTIVIDIPVKCSNPVVFCIVNKKKLKHVTQTNVDVAKLAGTFQIKGLNPNYHALGEASEIFDSLFDINTCKKLNDMIGLFHSIHYTDQKMFSESEGHLRAILYASNKNADKYLPALQLLFNLVDRIPSLKLSSSYKTKAFKARQVFNASIQKQKMQKHKQQLRKKKQQKKKQDDAWLRSLPPEKQKKQEEKRKKKEMNKLLKSRAMKVG